MVFLYGAGDYPAYTRALDKIGQEAMVSQDLSDAKRCAGLLLPGGGDIHSRLEESEAQVIRYFVTQERPILGICRGLQALNVYFGGILYDNVPGHQAAEGDIIHPTYAIGQLADLLGEYPVVNSNHHQAVSLLGRDLFPCQWACDGVIEGVCHKFLPIWGVQWHPERWIGGEAIFHRFGEMIQK